MPGVIISAMKCPNAGLPAPPSDPASVPAQPGDQQRLWAPWRMRYVGGSGESGCVFCRRLADRDDVRSLILHRGRHAFAIMNLYPYNTGHLMLVPNEHVAGPEQAAPEALAEMAALVPPTLRALRRVLRCDGFNIGINVGADAGAGVADHLHEHVVPRWEGDANFMPILAGTTVMPELIPATYAKVRADLERELGGSDEVVCVIVNAGRDRVLAKEGEDGWRLPRAVAGPEEALWQAARRAVDRVVGEAELVGWAGARETTKAGGGLAFAVPEGAALAARARWLALPAGDVLGEDARMVADLVDDGAIGGAGR